MLELKSVIAYYGRTKALHGVSLVVPRGATVALVGTNGAGKTTVVRSILGLLHTDGRILIDGRDIGSKPTHARVRDHAIAVVHEGRGLLGQFTVRENLLLGASKSQRARISHVLDLFPALRGRLDDRASLLSGGQQQMVALGRAMLKQPDFLLLDEPALGLAPVLTAEVYDQIRQLQRGGMGVLLVEQSLERARAIADELCLLKVGSVHSTASATDQSAIDDLVRAAFGRPG